MSRFVSFALLLVSATWGCRASNIEARDVLGTWNVSVASRDRLSAAQRDGAAILVLKQDGTFSASEMPADLLHVAPEAREAVVSGDGGWKVDVSLGRPRVQLDFRSIVAGKEGDVPFVTYLEVERDRARIALSYSRGDPDEGNRVTFEKGR